MQNLRIQRVLITIFLIVLASCSGPGATPTDIADSASEPIPELPACAEAGPAISLPAEFPSYFPLPPGTAIHASRNTEEGVLVIDGVVPADLQTAAAFFLRELPAAGFTLGFGDGELDEAESAFSGNGYQGQFKVHSILDCPGAVTLKLAITKEGE
jgi:hypothetical protein